MDIRDLAEEINLKLEGIMEALECLMRVAEIRMNDTHHQIQRKEDESHCHRFMQDHRINTNASKMPQDRVSHCGQYTCTAELSERLQGLYNTLERSNDCDTLYMDILQTYFPDTLKHKETSYASSR